MNKFSPICPKCNKIDEVNIHKEPERFWLDKYYCKGCKYVFSSREGYPPYTASCYQVTEGSIEVYSNSKRFVVTEEEDAESIE